jgi:hypothetical protein
MWELVDQIYIITYSGSPRIKDFKKEIAHWKIQPEKLTWNIRPKMEIPSCVMSSAIKNHIEAYRDAKSKGYINIIVLEDDIIVYDHLKTIPEISFKTNYFIEKYPNYNVLYYGYIPIKIDQDFADSFFLKMYGLLLHAYLIHERFYSLFLNLDIEQSVHMGAPFIKEAHDVWFFNLLLNQKRESYGVYPQLVYQNNMPLPCLFKKDNTCKETFKKVCDISTEICYNGNLYYRIFLLFILIIIMGKLK